MIEVNLAIKHCYKCKQWFPQTSEYFHKDPTTRDRFSNRCKKCKAIYSKKWYKENLSYMKRWYEENKERRKEYKKQYYQENKEHCKEYNKQWREKNLEYDKKRKKQWYEENPEYDKEYSRKRRKEKPWVRIEENISRAIHRSIRENKAGRRWEELVGYTLEKLTNHLESLFKPGMTWENHGRYGWHIDHIRPISSFSFKSYEDEEFLECWKLENLQPLWAEENLSKGNKILEQVEPDEKKD